MIYLLYCISLIIAGTPFTLGLMPTPTDPIFFIGLLIVIYGNTAVIPMVLTDIYLSKWITCINLAIGAFGSYHCYIVFPLIR